MTCLVLADSTTFYFYISTSKRMMSIEELLYDIYFKSVQLATVQKPKRKAQKKTIKKQKQIQTNESCPLLRYRENALQTGQMG